MDIATMSTVTREQESIQVITDTCVYLGCEVEHSAASQVFSISCSLTSSIQVTVN